MTQKQLGEVLGFLGKTSDVRMAQYESESRTPKHDLVKEMAGIFDVSTHALTVPRRLKKKKRKKQSVKRKNRHQKTLPIFSCHF